MASIQLSRFEAEEGDLPDVCMCCGAEATERTRRRFISHPLWVFLLLPALPLYLIVSIILTEHIRCYMLFCPRHKNYFFVRTLLVWGSLVAVMVLIIGGFFLALWLAGQVNESSHGYIFGPFCIGTIALLFGWLLSIPISQVTAIHPANATESRLTLQRVSPDFAEALRQHRASRKSQARPDDYQEHYQPRRSPQRRENRGDDRIEPE